MTEDERTEDGGKWKIVQCSVGPETAIPSLDIHHFDDRASEGSKALRRSKGAQDNGGDGDNAIIRIIYCRFRVGGSEGGRAVNE